MKSFDTLVADVYQMMETKEGYTPEQLLKTAMDFGKTCEQLFLDQMTPDEGRAGRLRLSAMGKPDRQIYNAYHGVEGEPLRGPTYIKFMYGHLIEAMILSLVKLSGHTVEDEQKELEVEGIKGHMDCRIDGLMVDVKSCSSYGFKKFKHNTLHEDDPFGYIAQLKMYSYAEGDTQYGWLAFDKQNGTLATLVYDESHTEAAYYDAVDWCPAERVRDVKKLVGSDLLPAHCYDPVPDGKSGNMKLVAGCAYCAYKWECWPGLQQYNYASGPRYLTEVSREPRAVHVPEGF